MFSGKKRIVSTAAFLMAVVVGGLAFGEGLDHIGVRVIIPLGKTPFMIGADIGTRLTFGWAMASLLLSPSGKTLMLASIEAKIAGSQSGGSTFFRGTIGLSYFDLLAPLPSLIFGGGLSYRLSFDEHISIAAGSEIIYPFALGPPMFNFSAGWSP